MSSRYFNPKFWRDNYIDSLDPSEKLLYIHTFTNPEARMCGIYEMPKRLMASDTGFNTDMLDKLFARLAKDKKAFYFDGWVCTLNTIKHQNINNGNTRKGLERELAEVPEKIMAHFMEMGTQEFRDTLSEFGVDVPTYSDSPIGDTVRVMKPIGKVKKVVKKKKSLEIVCEVYPEWLNTEAWTEWFEYRKNSKRKTITKPAQDKQWALLKKYSTEEQQLIINNSIQNDYQGLFDLKPTGGGMNNKKFHVA